MRLTKKQMFVLEHLHHVVRSKRPVSDRPRYDLDGWDCGYQITSLVIKELVVKTASGDVRRTGHPL